MARLHFRIVAFAVLFGLVFSGNAYCVSDRFERKIDECADVLDEIMMMPEQGIPDDLLTKAEAIGIFPTTVSGAFIFGGRFGTGVVVARDPKTRKWGAPAFYTIGGASFGFQIGGQATDIVLVITSRKGLNGLLKDSFTMGGDAAVAAGPVGRKGEVSTDLLMQASILSYSRSKGLFAGIALQGAVVSQDKEENKALYGPGITAYSLFSGKVPPTKEAGKLIKTLELYAP